MWGLRSQALRENARMKRLSNMRLQATVGGGFVVDKDRPRSPTAPEARRWAVKR